MINIYKLGILLSLSIIISGVQCTSLDYKMSVAGKNNSQIIEEKHQPNFSQDTIKIYKYLDSARTFLYLDANKVLSYSRVVLALSQKYQWSKGKILAYNLLSTYYLLDGSHDILRELSNETITLSERLNLPFYTAHAKRFIAESHSEYRAWPQAKINYQYALKLFTDLGQDSSRAICMENLGNLYRDTNNKDQAFKYYDEAYQIFVKIGFRSGQATVLQSKGYYYVKIEQYDKAMVLYEKAMQLYKEDHNFYGEINLLNDIGYLYYCNAKYDLAIETCLKALEYSKIYHSAQQTNWAHQTLGRAYKEKNMLKKAIYHSENAY